MNKTIQELIERKSVRVFTSKPKVSRKRRNKRRASGRKEHKAREDRAGGLGRAKAGNRLGTSEGWC